MAPLHRLTPLLSRSSARTPLRFQACTLPTITARRLESTSSSSPPPSSETWSTKHYDFIQVTSPVPRVALITLNRPKALNALNTPLINDLNAALASLAHDPTCHAVVLTGSERAFAAGADIKEMASLTFGAAYGGDYITSWAHVAAFPKPLVAAVNGFALGGGCELAMMADVIYASKTATFGQPEIKLGVTPGAGGSQRLTAAVGKSKAMELVLTGDNFSGEEAERWGLVARTFGSADETVAAAVKLAGRIAGYSRVAVKACKEVVNKSQDLSLREGLEFERRIFHGLFGSKDQKEGMEAFAGKRKAQWSHE